MEKEVMKMSRVLVIPYPGQGHINPILEFSKYLASKGLKITIITNKTVKKSAQIPLNNSIQIETISDGSEQEKKPESIEEYFKRFKREFSKNLAKFLDEPKSWDFSAKLIVYDSTMPWVLDIAHQRSLLAASFFTQSCSVSALYYYVKKGLLKFPYEDSEVCNLPFLPALEMKDLPSFSEFSDPKQIVMTHLVDQFSNLEEVDWIFFNTFDKLENEILDWMASKWSIKTVGPTFALPQKDTKLSKNHMISLFDPIYNEACTEWLNSKETSSIIYVSFGSIASLKKEQMEELAYGLLMSNWDFLWVVRASEEEKLPPNFTSLALERGCLIVNWCHQTEVLSHKAVACFMSHCGWNSTLEALTLGVPVIGMARWVDQTTNSKFIVDVWRVGVRVKPNENGIVEREEIVKCIEKVTQGDEGKEMRSNAYKLKQLANEAVEKGGTSAGNIEDFISELLCS
ncbi:hypothetical protein RD792_009778 [Penstemon davidsonii]|uniref:Glycosyltransferase n=1 Tax=Penstemon davidsonii TaxID=160366 RepID=A0ABR0CZZ9_9LAMI|nr:hypothetical protein RD792_009778 [Penstemon davidsonii]